MNARRGSRPQTPCIAALRLLLSEVDRLKADLGQQRYLLSVERGGRERIEAAAVANNERAEKAEAELAGVKAQRDESWNRERVLDDQAKENWKMVEKRDAEIERPKADLDGEIGFIGFRASAKVWEQQANEAEALLAAERIAHRKSWEQREKLEEALRVMLKHHKDTCNLRMGKHEARCAPRVVAEEALRPAAPACPHGRAIRERCDVCSGRGIWQMPMDAEPDPTPSAECLNAPDDTVGVPAAGSEQPDLPHEHRYRPWGEVTGGYGRTCLDCGHLEGQPESAHRRKP